MRYAGEEAELAALIEEAMQRDLELALLNSSLVEQVQRAFTREALAAFRLPGWDPADGPDV